MSLLLDMRYHAAFIDFNVTETSVKQYRKGCNYLVKTADTPFFGMKVVSDYRDDSISGILNCSFEMSLSGNRVNKTVYRVFPNNEIKMNTYGNVNVEIKFDKCMKKSYHINFFRLLIFKYGEVNCTSFETRCLNGARCVQADLACSDVYDFCNNDFNNCKRNSGTTTKRYKRRGPTSVRGIILGCICLTVLILFLLYIIVCRKRPWWNRFVQKLCRLQPRGRRCVPNERYTCRTNQIHLNTNDFQDPPPSYTELEHCHHNLNVHVQPRSETGNSSLNIPPPLYSSENTDDDSNVANELPPPYSTVFMYTDGVQYM
ncbi:uncharacterized protein LOC132753890 isoform X2 [Ruditapes philippinarum]|nr:uncharacterized protein LOC132753890 isoform X2 [Ruditapes philippinarum]